MAPYAATKIEKSQKARMRPYSVGTTTIVTTPKRRNPTNVENA
jgi:hypothetical protein